MRGWIAGLMLIAATAVTGGDGGATVRVVIERAAERGPLEVWIGIQRDEGELRWLATRSLAPSQSIALFRDLAAGSYVVLVRGREPLQRMTATAVVGDGDRRDVAVALPAGRVRARVALAGAALQGAEVVFYSRDAIWQAEATAGETGAIESGVWQPGEYDVGIGGAGLPSGVSTTVRIPAAGELTIDLPARRLRAQVRAADDSPVAGASIALRTERGGGATTVRARTDANGSAVFAGVATGRQTLRVDAPAFLRSEPVSFDVGEGDEALERVIVVNPGVRRTIELADTHGDPVAGAHLLCLAGGRVRAIASTDAAGRATIATPPREGGAIYAVPQGGSLVVHHYAASPDGIERLIVPAATASLDVEALGPQDVPMPRVKLLMRFNGELVPPEVARAMQARQPLAFATGDDGVARLGRLVPGVYELWPYASEAEAEALVASAAALAAPINVNVVTGENRVTVRFRRRH